MYSERAHEFPRARLSIFWTPEFKKELTMPENSNKKLSEIVDILENEKITVNTVKLFVDGVLESKTALLEAPYSDD